jgi:molybdate transport system substrate-binding protein
MTPLLRSALIGAICLALSAPVAKGQSEDAVLVFAAASLKNALDAALADYEARTGSQIVVSYAASSALARQIEEGAPADLFFSADNEWMNYLADKDLLATGTRVTLLQNDLALIAPTDSELALTIGPDFPIAAALGDGRLAMAATGSVPAGKYGRAALETLGVWDSVAGQVAEADNVRAALQLVARGEAPLGIVYATDARAEAGVKLLGVFAPASHPPILYPVAATAGARPAARLLLDFLASAAAAPHFEAQGFRFVAPGS